MSDHKRKNEVLDLSQPESPAMRAAREAQEALCRGIADELRAVLPPTMGFALVLADYGEDGSFSYVSTMQREDFISLLDEWRARLAPKGGA